MSISEAVDAVYGKLRADGLTVVQLENLHRALPVRGKRGPEHVPVAIGIARAYRQALRDSGVTGYTCRTLAAEHRARVGGNGRFVAPHGEPLDLVSEYVEVVDRELERRHGCDYFELWEASGGDVDSAGDTDQYTRSIVAEVERQCASTDRLYCEHN